MQFSPSLDGDLLKTVFPRPQVVIPSEAEESETVADSNGPVR